MKDNLSRRVFIEKLGACTFGGLALSQTLNRRASAQWADSTGGLDGMPRDTVPWTRPPALANPNILVIMVDQMRLPTWLNDSQLDTLRKVILPNIAGRIQANSYNFGQYYAVGSNCTPSRASLLTGLYVPQTAMYCTIDTGAAPALNAAFPTWGSALALLNSAYRGNVWWFGKWQLSLNRTANPLLSYGFKTRTYPGGPSPYNPSPNGAANEGTGGGLFNGVLWANDSQIADDFVGWLQGQAPTTGQPSTPWCATVSLVNPHDISFAPAFFQSDPFPPPGVPLPAVYFPPPSGSPPSLYTSHPVPWNFEYLQQVANKPSLQKTLLTHENARHGTVSDWALFLNQYYWLQNFVDGQVGRVLDALYSSAFASNTIVIFLSDHGEYAGSHGLHSKGWAAYDESIRVPLTVQFPGQTGQVGMNQMCCSVDFFGLICDLATGGGGQWKLQYPDLARRQSLWSFLYDNSSETRLAPAPIGLPYVLHTFDETEASRENPMGHIVCLRTKRDLNAGMAGGKLAFYWKWADCTTYPDSTAPEAEFYDYNPQTTNNAKELGNDYYSTDQNVYNKVTQYAQALGTWGPPATGLIGGELNPPLLGTGTDGNPLSQALATARQTYFDFAFRSGTCPA